MTKSYRRNELTAETWIDVPFNENAEQFIRNAKGAGFNLIDYLTAIPMVERYSNNVHERITVEHLNRVSCFKIDGLNFASKPT